MSEKVEKKKPESEAESKAEPSFTMEIKTAPTDHPVPAQEFAAVAKQEGKEVALAVGSINPKKADIEYFVVNRDARQAGMGSTVVPVVEQVLKNKGVEVVQLTDAATRTGKETHFWNRLGYKGITKEIDPNDPQTRVKIIQKTPDLTPTPASSQTLKNIVRPLHHKASEIFSRAKDQEAFQERTGRPMTTSDVLQDYTQELKEARTGKVKKRTVASIAKDAKIAHEFDPTLYPDITPLLTAKEKASLRKAERQAKRAERERARPRTTRPRGGRGRSHS
jgi:N-acetylglutamate synthase-like GNAT family acetyltransferase